MTLRASDHSEATLFSLEEHASRGTVVHMLGAFQCFSSI